MPLLHETLRVARSVEDCYRYLLDFSTIEQWDPGVYRARKVTPGAPGVGTEFELMLQMPGRRVPMRYRLEHCEAPGLLQLRGEGEGFKALDTLRLQALDATHTMIDYRAQLDFQGAAAVVVPLLGPWLRRVGVKAVTGLKRALEVESSVVEPGLGSRLSQRLILPAARRFTQAGYLEMPNRGLSEFMDGQTVAVTGPTAGLGLAAACEFARLGARVVLVGRDAARLTEAQAQVAAFSGASLSRLPIYAADLSRPASLRAAAAQILQQEARLDVLVNNAGALFNAREVTPEGHERAFAINLLAPYLLTEALLPALRAARGRIVNVVSGGLYLQPLRLDDLQYELEPYDGAKAYARAKRGLLAQTVTWAQAERVHGVRVNAMHPGWAATPGVSKSLPAFERAMGKRLRDARMGADTIVWLAASHAAGAHSGRFWLDRRPQLEAVLPGTAVTPAARETLQQRLRALADAV